MAKTRLIFLVGFTLCLASCEDDPYSFISPNSAFGEPIIENQSQDKTYAPHDISKYGEDHRPGESATLSKPRAKRSPIPDPILSTVAATDDYLVFKNVDETLEGNDVEMSGRYGIHPSKTDRVLPSDTLRSTPLPSSGESRGAPHARALQEPQEIRPSATTAPRESTASPTYPQRGQQGRQANPDIQDIISGIVKLLNGNVNVQANTVPPMGSRPLRPLPSRINNRGPPKITDVPALPPDFDVPAPLPPPPLGQMPPPLTTTRLPTPYPFEGPHNISPARPIPLSDHSHVQKPRPGFYRPTTGGSPWGNRRGPPNRRPSIPPYKPMPPFPADVISLTSERPLDDILTFDLGSHLSTSEAEEVEVEEEEEVEEHQEVVKDDKGSDGGKGEEVKLETSEETDKEIAEFEKNKEKVTKLDKYTSKTTSITPTFNTPTARIPLNTTSLPTSSVQSTSKSTIQIDTSSIKPTTTSKIMETSMVMNISVTGGESIATKSPMLESSEVSHTIKEELLSNVTQLSSVETEKLPTSSPSTISTTSTVSTSTTSTDSSLRTNSSAITSSSSFPYYSYRPRPGIVLDDTEFKPGGINRQPIITRPPIGQLGDIFDITVSAIQGPGGGNSAVGKPYVIPVDIENVHSGHQDVITSSVGTEGFVSIDGKRTYLSLFDDASTPAPTPLAIKPTAALHNQVTGTGYAVVDNEKIKPGLGGVKPVQRRPIYGRPRPSQPPVRIDTCIVGDDSTCDVSQHEICRTESGVSACHCRPGTARRKHRDPCRKIVSILLSLRVDKLYERKVVWADELGDKNSDSFLQLSFEAERALESAMSMTPFSDEFLAARVNSIYKGDRTQGQGGVFVNLTLQLDENADTSRPTVRGDIQKHLLGVIQRRSNNVGESALWVDSPPGSISHLQDVDECSSTELHDCHDLARCVNVFGGFRCECEEGSRDPWADNKHRAGRHCERCSSQHCNNRGECKYQNGMEVCVCSGNYYGSQCELDGEVLGVAIGASVAAIIIIGLTLVCLVMWSRRWSREQKAAVGSPVFGYMATASNTVKTPVVGAPPYQLTLEDRLRWAQIADVMAQTNHYAPEPGLTAPTRPSSAMFGYPNIAAHMGSLQHHHHGTLPPVPLPRLTLQAAHRAASTRPPESTSSEEEDKADLLGRSFQVPRPKSRSNASIANQSGIYYDVDYDQNEIYKQSGGIPLSTYSMGRQQYFRN